MSFTPGPWKVTCNGPGCRTIGGDKRGLNRQAQYKGIAVTVGLSNDKEDRCNARLIAAAPELLTALKALVDLLNDDLDSEQCAAWGSAVAAINKAEVRKGHRAATR